MSGYFIKISEIFDNSIILIKQQKMKNKAFFFFTNLYNFIELHVIINGRIAHSMKIKIMEFKRAFLSLFLSLFL